MKIGYIEYAFKKQYRGIYKDEDAELLAFLKEKGLDIESLIWTDPDIDWRDYEVVILKSPWDYHERIGEFYDWLEYLQKTGVRLLNPAEMVRWNSNKKYLADIMASGLPVIPSRFLEAGSRLEQAEIYFKEFGTDRLVVKPCVSGGAKNTVILTPDSDHTVKETINRLLAQESFLIQPFVDEIKNGEWSFVFFNGRYSHHVLKVPGQEDFRVQQQHGGITKYDVAGGEAYAGKAQQYIQQFAGNTLYARVDGVIMRHGFYLMELEMIEPYLFLNGDKSRMENYLGALNNLLWQGTDRRL